MRKSGLADSPFFSTPQKEGITPLPDKSSRKERQGQGNSHTRKPRAAKQPSSRDTVKPRDHETMPPRYHDTVIELVRKAVREFGKEAATHRFTPEEKKAIAAIIYSYKNRGVRTSENEIARIAVNFVINDYRENGENSLLDRTLKALNE